MPQAEIFSCALTLPFFLKNSFSKINFGRMRKNVYFCSRKNIVNMESLAYVNSTGTKPLRNMKVNTDCQRTVAASQNRRQFDEEFAKLKAEADAKYGTGKRMSVDEYFDKLWYIVEGLYENV